MEGKEEGRRGGTETADKLERDRSEKLEADEEEAGNLVETERKKQC